MKIMASRFLVILCLISTVMSAAAYQNFSDKFYMNFGQFNTKLVGAEAQLSLTQASGSGFRSIDAYLFGSISMKVKLVANNSAGIVASYYLSSTWRKHCELDFEFLGNVSGQPYALQTNVFVEGKGDREQRITLWFDPSAQFHTYGILWNQDLVLFYVDDKAIRVFKNAQYLGVPYLDYQEMYSYSSIWDGGSWVPRGGRDKIHWASAPFNAQYTDFDIEACAVKNGTGREKHSCYRKLYRSPYGNKANRTLTSEQWNDLKWIKHNWLTYDYCTDKTRWTSQPKECSINWPA